MCHSVLVRLSSYKNTKITMQPGHLTLASPSRRACRQVEPRNHRHPCGNKKVTNLGCCEQEYVHLEPDGWQHKNPILKLINCLVHRKVKATLILSPASTIYKVNRCLARYSPRATTTNRPTTGHWISLHGLAQIDQKCQFWAKFGRFGAKNPNFYWKNQKFCYPHNRKPT